MPEPAFLFALAPNGKNLYVPLNGTIPTVAVIDTGTNQITASIPLLASPGGVVVSPDSSTVYVVNNQFQDNVKAGGFPRSLQSPPQGAISVIDAASAVVTAYIPIPYNGGSLAISPDGKTLYVIADGQIYAIDSSTGATATEILDTLGPEFLVASPDGAHI